MDYHIAPPELGILEESTNAMLANKIHANHSMAVMDSVSNCKYRLYDRSLLSRLTPEGGGRIVLYWEFPNQGPIGLNPSVRQGARCPVSSCAPRALWVSNQGSTPLRFFRSPASRCAREFLECGSSRARRVFCQ